MVDLARSSVANPLTSLQLRCQSCGAAYAGRPDGEILTCTYCGTSQRVVDAREFLDHFMAQVTAFVRQAVPVGLDGSRADGIDPVARLAAFNSSIRPRVSVESEQYRFSCFRALSAPLTVLPFSQTFHPSAGTDPTSVSVFAAKVQSVAGLAVDDASRELLVRAGGLASAYQSILVATRLLGGSQPERFQLISQNYSTASRALESTGKWPPLVARLSGLAEEVRAVDLWLSARNTMEAKGALARSTTELERARRLLASSPELGYLLPSVDLELAAVRTVATILEITDSSPTVSPAPHVFVQRLSGILDWQASRAPGHWAAAFRSAKSWEQIFASASRLRAAQAGRGSVKVVSMGAGAFLPFWLVEIPYTFETGVLWAKRGKEVPEVLLVSATFPTDLYSLDGVGSARVLTDVFAVTAGSRGLEGQLSRIRGQQERISESGPLHSVLQRASASSLSGQPAVPPFTTDTDALRLVQTYIAAMSSVNPKVASQLRVSSPRILDLVYVSCNSRTPPYIPALGPLSPASVGDPNSFVGFLS